MWFCGHAPYFMCNGGASRYTSGHMETRNVLVVAGLALGAVFGMAGSMVTNATLRSAFWAIDSVGLIVATVLLTVRCVRAGNDVAAAGFAVFALGESVILSGTAGTLEASVPSFAAGMALWSAGLLLTSIPRQFVVWGRMAGITAGVLFAVTAGRIFCGETILPIAAPLPFFAYPFLVLTFAGWAWTVATFAADRDRLIGNAEFAGNTSR